MATGTFVVSLGKERTMFSIFKRTSDTQDGALRELTEDQLSEVAGGYGRRWDNDDDDRHHHHHHRHHWNHHHHHRHHSHHGLNSGWNGSGSSSGWSGGSHW